MRVSKALGLALGLAVAGPGTADPARVVSMNVCTDQLLMLVAEPGQILSVSHLARDPSMSAMSVEALRFGINHGRAEEIYLAAPDLVIASTFSNPATVAMLRRVGLEVVQFAPAMSISDIADRLRLMGQVLGQSDRAEGVVAALEENLAAVDSTARGRAALYGVGGYYRGPNTLAGDIVAAAGYTTVSDVVGRDFGGFLSLEELVMSAPDLLVTPGNPGASSRAHSILDHPALAAFDTPRAQTDRNWVCGTPAVSYAVNALAEATK